MTIKNTWRTYAVSALAAGAVAGAAAVALTGPAAVSIGKAQPLATYNLAAAPARLLPANVSSEQPARIVTTSLDAHGRPVVTTRTATSKGQAAALIAAGQHAKNAVGVTVDHAVHALDLASSTDPDRADQWDLNKTNVPAAWQRSTGAGVVVAVIDTGLDTSHPDLAGQSVPGWDVLTNKASDGTDPDGHGTHVSGTIAALTGNGVGVSGIAPDAKIMPVRVLDANGSGWMSDVATGVYWAVAHGAEVINMSIGSTGDDPTLAAAITYAHDQGVTVVAAAGNDRADGSPTSYPGADADVIAVAATDSNDAVASFSNAGSYVDVAAPGVNILSTLPGNKYGYYSGTSMASPHVAALAAMIKSYNPALTPDQIEQDIENTAADLGPTGKDTDFGYGRIDYAAALAAAAPATTAPTTEPTTDTPSSAPSSTDAPLAGSSSSSDPAGAAPSSDPSDDPSAMPSASDDTPTSSPSPSVVAPTVTASASGVRTANYGSSVSGSYTVTAAGAAWAGKPAQVCVAGATGAFTCTATATNGSGVVTFARKVTAPMRMYLSVPATATSAAAGSPTLTVRVQVTATVTRSSSTALVVAIGGVNGQKVQVERLDGKTWVTAKTVTAAARVTVSGLAKGKTYRVVVPSTSTFTGVTSATVKL